jgi:hypothetical protein
MRSPLLGLSGTIQAPGPFRHLPPVPRLEMAYIPGWLVGGLLSLSFSHFVTYFTTFNPGVLSLSLPLSVSLSLPHRRRSRRRMHRVLRRDLASALTGGITRIVDALEAEHHRRVRVVDLLLHHQGTPGGAAVALHQK